MNTNNAILIVGGSGVVGQQIAHLIRQCHPDFPLIIAGINLEKAETFARELKNSTAIAMNVENPKPLNGLSPRIVLSIVNDPHDFLLRDSIAAGVPYIDITRWSERVRSVISC